ncbi:MAG: energy transducer TonB [Reyranellales bacterium]
MAHAVSASYFRSDHMSPSAVALALALHVAMALALWWMSTLKPELPTEEPIEVTMERPKPPEPAPQPARPESPPPPPVQASPPAPKVPTVPLGLPPPAPTAPEPSRQAPPKEEQAATPQQTAPPAPPVEQVVPPPAPPPPPPTTFDFPKPALPPLPKAPPKPPQPPQRAQTPPSLQLRTSPLSHLPQQTPPPDSQAAAPSTFVNPAEAAAKTRTIDAYLWQVLRKFSQYLPNLRVNNEEGTVVLRLVIARDGRLIDATIAQSSGRLTLDRVVLESIRSAAPFAPLPPELQGDQIAFTLPITSKRLP